MRHLYFYIQSLIITWFMNRLMEILRGYLTYVVANQSIYSAHDFWRNFDFRIVYCVDVARVLVKYIYLLERIPVYRLLSL
jgi:hypothetical protein